MPAALSAWRSMDIYQTVPCDRELTKGMANARGTLKCHLGWGSNTPRKLISHHKFKFYTKHPKI
uniref:Uncharacterized protein n=1 Tax=Oryza nivara TaxID=4536 RepID=A0A0E0J569_ORYNI